MNKLDVEEIDDKYITTPHLDSLGMKLPSQKPVAVTKAKPGPKPSPPKVVPLRMKCPNCSATFMSKTGLKKHMAVRELAEYR